MIPLSMKNANANRVSTSTPCIILPWSINIFVQFTIYKVDILGERKCRTNILPVHEPGTWYKG